ncbi:MAG: hypothetical protein ACRYHA_12565 [Janthinobacterium lividum]
MRRKEGVFAALGAFAHIAVVFGQIFLVAGRRRARLPRLGANFFPKRALRCRKDTKQAPSAVSMDAKKDRIAVFERRTCNSISRMNQFRNTIIFFS